jgi:hypothetical protein
MGYLKRNNPELGLSSYRSTSQVADPTIKSNEIEALKYKHP